MLPVMDNAKSIRADLITKLFPRIEGGNEAIEEVVNTFNNCIEDEEQAIIFRDNIIGYSNVVRNSGKQLNISVLKRYLAAVSYVTYKLMGCTNEEAWSKTFPERVKDFEARGDTKKYLKQYSTAFSKTYFVVELLKQSYIPTWIANQDLFQKAINVQADLMMNAKSEKVRTDAASCLIQHLARPEVKNPLLQIDMRETNGINDLREAIVNLAKKQQEVIENGTDTKEIAEEAIVKKEEEYE